MKNIQENLHSASVQKTKLLAIVIGFCIFNFTLLFLLNSIDFNYFSKAILVSIFGATLNFFIFKNSKSSEIIEHHIMKNRDSRATISGASFTTGFDKSLFKNFYDPFFVLKVLFLPALIGYILFKFKFPISLTIYGICCVFAMNWKLMFLPLCLNGMLFYANLSDKFGTSNAFTALGCALFIAQFAILLAITNSNVLNIRFRYKFELPNLLQKRYLFSTLVWIGTFFVLFQIFPHRIEKKNSFDNAMEDIEPQEIPDQAKGQELQGQTKTPGRSARPGNSRQGGTGQPSSGEGGKDIPQLDKEKLTDLVEKLKKLPKPQKDQLKQELKQKLKLTEDQKKQLQEMAKKRKLSNSDLDKLKSALDESKMKTSPDFAEGSGNQGNQGNNGEKGQNEGSGSNDSRGNGNPGQHTNESKNPNSSDSPSNIDNTLDTPDLPDLQMPSMDLSNLLIKLIALLGGLGLFWFFISQKSNAKSNGKPKKEDKPKLSPAEQRVLLKTFSDQLKAFFDRNKNMSDYNGLVIQIYNEWLKKFETIGIPIEKHWTADDFLNKFQEFFPGLKKEFSYITVVFVHALFAKQKIPKEIWEQYCKCSLIICQKFRF